jgi:hypothetical protein
MIRKKAIIYFPSQLEFEMTEMKVAHEKELESSMKILEEIKKLESDESFLEESVIKILQEKLHLAR